MSGMRQSVFRKYSIGVVAENAAIGDKQILVIPIEDTPYLDGVLKSNPQIVTTKGTDAEGQAYEVNAMTDTTVTATWLPDSANRISAPNVRRNTRVQLYRMGDSDTFYWRDMGLDGNLLRQETVIYAWNNNPNAEGDDVVDAASAYFLEISTHTGHVTFATSKSNGEPMAFTFQINAKEGKFIFGDDDENGGNQISMDAVAKHFQAILSTGTEFNLNQNNIYGFAPDSITFKATNNINMQCKAFSLEATDSFYCQTETFDVKAPKGSFSGIWTVGALATTSANGYTGKATIDAELEVLKDFTAKANVNVTGTLHAQKVVSDQDISAPNV
jgi:hypothetical protein